MWQQRFGERLDRCHGVQAADLSPLVSVSKGPPHNYYLKKKTVYQETTCLALGLLKKNCDLFVSKTRQSYKIVQKVSAGFFIFFDN